MWSVLGSQERVLNPPGVGARDWSLLLYKNGTMFLTTVPPLQPLSFLCNVLFIFPCPSVPATSILIHVYVVKNSKAKDLCLNNTSAPERRSVKVWGTYGPAHEVPDLWARYLINEVGLQLPQVLWNTSWRCVTFVYVVEHLLNDAKLCCIFLCCNCLTLWSCAILLV